MKHLKGGGSEPADSAEVIQTDVHQTRASQIIFMVLLDCVEKAEPHAITIEVRGVLS